MEIGDGEVGKETWEVPTVIWDLKKQKHYVGIQGTDLYLRLGGEGDLRRRWGEGERRLRAPGEGERLFLEYKTNCPC